MLNRNIHSILKSRFSTKANPYNYLRKSLNVKGTSYDYYSLPHLNSSSYNDLPYSIRVLLESAVRNCDEFAIKSTDIARILNWKTTSAEGLEIPFKPARVVLQDFTGVPSIVNLASMRNCISRLGSNPEKVNPIIPVDLVIDHSVMSDFSRISDAVEKNEALEFQRNYERFEFLKWGQQTFSNLLVVPPGSGIVHQVNLEYLARVAFHNKAQNLLYPDSLVGADSHTTMINGLGVVGWGVGGIEAEAVMLGEPISMVLPPVVGFYLDGELNSGVTATDLVLTITQILRKKGVVGQFVEFFGPGVSKLSLADRSTIANMAPEYGATMGYFPVDDNTLKYMRLTGRDEEKVLATEHYFKKQNMFQTHEFKQQAKYTGEIVSLNLNTVESCISGPKRPHDKVTLKKMQEDWNKCLRSPVGFKGYGLTEEKIKASSNFTYQGKSYTLNNGSVILAAITSCTNTSNPESMLAAGLLAQNAVKKGLSVSPFIKTTLSPGSGVVTKYFEESGLSSGLKKLGFETVGYGCMTCIGNTGELDPEVSEAIQKNDLVVAAVLSGNRNFEARIHPLSRANYLASPPLVVAYALAGRIDIDFEKEPIGFDTEGKPVFLKDIWPDRTQLQSIAEKFVNPRQFKEVYSKIAKGTDRWNQINVPGEKIYKWNLSSTYIHEAPFFKDFTVDLKPIKNINNAYCLLNFGDSITTDHISPAGNIAKSSPAGKYLAERGISPKDFNSYGSRRGNDEIMARGTFANTRIINKMISKVGPETVHIPSGKTEDVFTVSQRYCKEGHQLIVMAGQEYGTGSSRDWAAKGPYLLGINAIIAQSFERIHRSNLVGMGILPLQFKPEEGADELGLDGTEQFTIDLKGGNLKIGEKVLVKTSKGKTFETICRLDTEVEVEYFKHGGILQYVLRKLIK